jgi:hypothetical protein
MTPKEDAASAQSVPAFPCEWDYINSNREAANGMTLRDYFAAKAMHGLILDSHYQQEGSFKGWSEFGDEVAGDAYALADAMLKARQA